MIIPTGHALIRNIWTLDGDPEPMISTIGVEVVAPWDVEEVAEAAYNAFTSSFEADDLGSEYTYQGVSVTMGPVPGTGPTAEHIEPVQGTSVQLRPPSNLAVLIRKVTALGGRQNRGRMFLPAGYIAEGNVDSRGFLSTALVEALQEDADDYWTALDGDPLDTMNPVILHTDPGDAPTPITALRVQTLAATQRRRMRR